MDKTYIIDTASVVASRSGGRKLSVNLIEPTVEGQMVMITAPLLLEKINPSADEIDKWVPNSTVTGTFTVTAGPTAATGATGSTGATGASGATGA